MPSSYTKKRESPIIFFIAVLSKIMSGDYFTLAKFSARFKNFRDLVDFSDVLGPPLTFNPIEVLTSAKPEIDLYGLSDLYPQIKKVLIHNHLKVTLEFF